MNNSNKDRGAFSFDLKLLWVPACALAVLTVIFRITSLDLMVSHLFFSAEQGFFLKKNSVAVFFYNKGNIPAFALAGLSILLVIKGRTQKEKKYWSKSGLFFLVFLLLGPGLIVHTVFKDNWGRPRPRDIIEFDGEHNYLKVWQKGAAGQGKSFPSGHAAIGYFMMAPFFVFYPRGRKRLALLFLILGFSYGSVMGACRVMEGAHFLSDVLWSTGFVYYTGMFLSFVFYWKEIVNLVKQDLKIKNDN